MARWARGLLQRERGTSTERAAGMLSPSGPSSDVNPDQGRWSRKLQPLVPDIVLAISAAALVFVVHNVHAMLTRPFFLDEAWVAISTRATLSEVGWVTASTPIGWTLLLRVVWGDGLERYRIVTLCFAAASVAAAYVLGRTLGWLSRWEGRLCGVLAATVALLSPAALLRQDLKQYTADAFVVVLIVVLVSRVEQTYARQRLVCLGVVAVAGMLFSHATAFAGPAAFLGLAATVTWRRQWARARDVLVAGASTAVGMATVYLIFDRKANSGVMRTYWRDFYLPTDQGLGYVFSYFRGRWSDLTPGEYLPLRDLFGMGPWWVAGPLVVAGLVTMVRLGRTATAATFVILLGGMITASAVRLYPLLDVRTSHFLIVSFGIVAAVGLAGLITVASRFVGRRVGLVLAALVFVMLVTQAAPYVRDTPPIQEDVRAQVAFVVDNRKPGDVVLVSTGAQFGVGYYLQTPEPEFVHSVHIATKFVVRYPSSDNIVIASDRSSLGIRDALAEAQSRVEGRGRIWIIRSHVNAAEKAEWNEATLGLKVKTFDVGPEPLLRISQSTSRR